MAYGTLPMGRRIQRFYQSKNHIILKQEDIGIPIKMVRRSFTVIKKALPSMFLYLKDDKIPNSTNSLKSFFGHLKGNLDSTED